MDAGTAKPSRELREAVPHHLLDVVDPDEPYDASAWKRAALAVLREIEQRGRLAIVCGGTGLYVRCLTRGLFAGPPADPALRAKWEREEEREPGVLHRRLLLVDPRAGRRIHPNDRVRTIRALEVYERTGRPISDWHAEHGLAERPFDVLTLAVDVEPGVLGRRIAERAQAMVENGLLDELAELRARGYPPDLKAFSAIGYREAGSCLDGLLPRASLISEIEHSTRRYAKRQRVWVRGQTDARRVADGSFDAALALAEAFFESVAKRGFIG
jgi:tRNA dimethylallyltransferase